MTELAWHVGPLGSGKSGRLITTHNDFERQGLSTLVMKSAIDTKTGDLIGSRANEVRIEPDFLVPPDMTGEQLYDELLQREHHIWEHDFADLDKIARDLGSKALSSGLFLWTKPNFSTLSRLMHSVSLRPSAVSQ